jgi:hypothetical protein
MFDELRRYVAFESEGAEWEQISEHLHRCRDCRIILLGLLDAGRQEGES